MPLNLPDKLPAIELLKEENIFVIDHFPRYAARYSSATDCDSEPDAVEDYNGNRLGALTFEYTSSGGDFVYEDQESHVEEYADRTHENVLYGFRSDAS